MPATDDDDEEELPVTLKTGEIETLDEDHNPHTYLYVPDLASETGWASHRVPEGKPATPRSPLGFRR